MPESKFDKLKNKLSHEKGVYDPAGLAALIGRKAEGPSEFEHKAEEGRKAAAHDSLRSRGLVRRKKA